MAAAQTSTIPSRLLGAAIITSSSDMTGSEGVAKAPLTAEQIKHIELNRLRAKARQREVRARTETDASTSTPNANGKRPLKVTAADSTSPTAPSKRAYERKEGDEKALLKPLKKNSRLSKYYEYDLSKMTNSKGGFLVEDEGGGPGKEVDEETRRREKLREKERVAKNAEPFRLLDPALNPKCRECGSQDIDHIYQRTFRCLICNTCKNTYPEKYSLLTKTECKEDYILTDSELRDEELLPHMLKPNPHQATWNNMMLFLRYQVEEFAWKKWGSPEKLDEEFYKREEQKRKNKGRKFEKGLRELRRKTREGIWQKRQDEEHVHDFGAVVFDDDEDEDGEEGLGRQRCKECGFEIEVEIF